MMLSGWRGASERRYRIVTLMSAILAAILIYHMVDYLFQSPLYALAALILLSIPGNEGAHSIRIRKPSGLRIGAIVLGGLASMAVVYTLRGSFLYWKGVAEARKGNIEEGMSLIC